MSMCNCKIDKEVNEECGIFAITKTDDSNIDLVGETYYALYALQHRGQESCGITVNDDGVLATIKGVGLVPEVLTQEKMAQMPKGNMAIGHVRYAPKSQIDEVNAQPMVVRHAKGTLALAANCALVNAVEIRQEMQKQGTFFQTTNDAETMAYCIARKRLETHSIEEALALALEKFEGAYSLVVMSPTKVIAARDPQGFKPLCIGKLKGGYIFASETCALNAVGAEFVRDVKAGEIVEIKDNQLIVYREGVEPKGLCVFEYVYTARPDSIIEGCSVHRARRRAGELLAKAHPVDADVVIGAPDSGLDAAQGYAQESGIPYGVGLLKNRYIGRTFIQPVQSQRENSVKIKLNPISETILGKRVVLVDDSVVRGTTSERVVRLLKEAGAAEVHLRITSPPFKYLCYFGTDIGKPEDLMANRMPIEDMAAAMGADSIGFLSLEDTKKMASGICKDYCVGCFSGEYPVDVSKATRVDKFDKKIKDIK